MTDSARDDATRMELDLRKALSKVRFAIELNPGRDEIDDAMSMFSTVVAQSGDVKRALKRFPAVSLMALVGHAVLQYRDFWDTLWESVGLDRNIDVENALRHAVPDLLQRCGLDPMADLIDKQQYVLPLAAHAGIPRQSVNGLLGALEDYARAGHDLDAPSFIEWLTDVSVEHRLNRIDAPVQAFIAQSGVLAVNVIDRIIDVAKFTMEQPDMWQQLPLDTATTGVPDVVLKRVLDRLATRSFLSENGGQSGAAVMRRPKVRYSVDENQVVIDLPYPEDGPTVPWQVSTARDTVDVVAQRAWGVLDGQHPPTSAAVTEVVPEVTVAHEPSASRVRIDLFSAEDPFILFTAEGRWIKVQGALPRGTVLVLLPNDATVHDSETDRMIRSAVPLFSPIGWRGWRVHTLNLADHDGLYVNRAGSKQRVVHTVSRGSAEFFFGDAVTGLRTVTGRAVFSSRPAVDFPATHNGEPVKWTVSTRRVGSMDWTECDWETGSELTSIDPFDGIDGPLLGDYEIRAQRGAAKLERTVFLAEGLEVDFGGLRMPEAGGLSSCVAALYSEDGLAADPGYIALAASERDAKVSLTDGARTFEAIIRPPCVELRIDTVGHPADWRVTPAALTVKDFEKRRVVAVRLPDAASVEFRLLALDGELRWSQVGKQKSADVFSVNSDQFVDTLNAMEQGQIVAHATANDGKTFVVSVCAVTAIKRVETVAVVDGQLVFDGLADIHDPAAWIWQATAPWKPVQQVLINDGTADLPVDLVGAGGLIVEVFSNDPFGSPMEPTRPGHGAVMAPQGGWARDEDVALDDLAAYLADVGALPSVDSAMAQVWAALKILPYETVDQRKTRAGLLSLLGHDPRGALEALGDSSLDEVERVSMLIETGLVSKPFAATNTENPLHLNPWVGSLVEISDLPSLRLRAEEGPEERAETLAYLEKQGGAPLIELLRVGSLRDPRVGTFDSSVSAYDRMPAAQLEKFVAESQLVPTGMLELDSRVKVLLDGFASRGKWSRNPARENLNVIPLYKRLKRKHPRVADLIVARNEALDDVDVSVYPWATVPIVSLTLAIAARLTAHKLGYHLLTPQIREAWVTMATMFPGLVATDLLIAEAAVSHAKYGDLIGDAR